MGTISMTPNEKRIAIVETIINAANAFDEVERYNRKVPRIARKVPFSLKVSKVKKMQSIISVAVGAMLIGMIQAMTNYIKGGVHFSFDSAKIVGKTGEEVIIKTN